MDVKRMIEAQANNLKGYLYMRNMADAQLQEIQRRMHSVVKIADGGKGPEPQYPRYFILYSDYVKPNRKLEGFWRVSNSGKVFLIEKDRQIQSGITEGVLKNSPSYVEVDRQEIEKRFVKKVKPYKPEPETCVWTWDEGKQRYTSPHICGLLEMSKYLMGSCFYCPQCGQSVKAHIPEPAIPEGYRVLEPWEVEVSNFLQKRPEVYYRRPRNAIYPQEWERRIMCVKKNWDVNNSEYAVPADWSPLPKCRDCGGRTELFVDDLAGCREYQIICDASGNRCTSGPLKSTKAEAVKAYPI